MSEWPKKLDKYSLGIVLVLCQNKSMGFNELHRALKKSLKISQPTLSARLKELGEIGFIKREEISFQKVAYTLNLKDISKLRDVVAAQKRINSLFKQNTNEFFALPIEEQLKVSLGHLVARKANEIYAKIQAESDPNNFEKQMVATLWSNTEDLQGQELWIINKAIVDADYRKNVLKELNEIGEGENE